MPHCHTFDTPHAELLQQIAPDPFTVLHRIDAHVFQFQDSYRSFSKRCKEE